MFVLNELQGDLFTSNDNLAHCVSADLKMSKGIAYQFLKRFGCQDELKSQNKMTGEVAYIVTPDNKYIFYLITKLKYYQKPTMNSLRVCLNAMKELIKSNSIKTLSMPRIGCGLDKLNWEDVKRLISDVFGDLDLTITVYSLTN